MPQIATNFILRSKLPNFERDSFQTFHDMETVDSSWIDEGHISYCYETGKHYRFNSNNGTLSGGDRWTELSLNLSEVELPEYITYKDNITDLTDALADELPTGALVYVIADKQYYYNSKVHTNAIQNHDYIENGTGWFRPLNDESISREEIEEIKNSIPTIDHLASKEELSEYVKKGDLPSIEFDDSILEDYAKKEDLVDIENQIKTINSATGAISTDLDDYKKEVDSIYTKKDELNNYVTYSEFQNNSSATINRVIKVETDIENINKDIENIKNSDLLDKYKEEVEETYSTKKELNDHISDFESYKEEVEKTYVKPEDISAKLNNYSPNVKHENRWIGSEYAGDLAGKTGKEIANEAYSYSAVLDEMLFGEYTPSISQPSVYVDIKPNWNGGLNIDWYDEENRIILVKSGSTGPDGADFIAKDVKDAIISYPKSIDLSTNFTTGLIPSTDEKQMSIGFCKVKDENGEWVYYKKENNIYHVPSTLDAGEYRYHYAAYFQKGSPALNNDGMTIAEWNENIAVESDDYITIIASKPTYYNTKDGFVENPLVLWTDNICDYMTLKPSCQIEQSFKLPRKIKELYIWNDISGYAKVPMVYQKDEEGKLTENLVPAYFTESSDENDYYTYIYDSMENGHRGEIKIKVIF